MAPVDVVIGRIGRAHGVRGEVSIESRTDEPDRRYAPGAVLLTDPPAAGPLTVSAVRSHGDRLLVSFEEVADRGTAEGLRGVLLTVEADPAAAPPDPDEFYDHQLIGLRVEADGAEVGEVARVLHHPAHDVLVVRRSSGGEAMVPFVADLVPEVDVASGRLTVANRPGLLEPEMME